MWTEAVRLSPTPVTGEHDSHLNSILSLVPQQGGQTMVIRPINESAWVKSYSERDETLRAKATSGLEGFYQQNGVIFTKGKLFVPHKLRNNITQEP